MEPELNDMSGQPTVPPAPQPAVGIRSMESDIKSTQEQGRPAPQYEPISVTPPVQSNNTPVFQPEMAAALPEVSGGGGKKIFGWLFIVVLLIAGGWGGYYYYKNYWSVNAPTEATIGQEVSQPTESEAPVAETAKPTPAKGNIDFVSLLNALRGEASQPLPPDNLKEILLVNEINQQISSVNFLLAVLPDLEDADLADTLKKDFQEGFKAYLYYDDKGVWPIYVIPLKTDSTTDVVSLKNILAELENADVANFYLDAPGTGVGFKDGQVKGFSTRYNVFSQPGAGFNYGLINNSLIISTSYNGLNKLLSS